MFNGPDFDQLNPRWLRQKWCNNINHRYNGLHVQCFYWDQEYFPLSQRFLRRMCVDRQWRISVYWRYTKQSTFSFEINNKKAEDGAWQIVQGQDAMDKNGFRCIYKQVRPWSWGHKQNYIHNEESNLRYLVFSRKQLSWTWRLDTLSWFKLW